MADESSVSAERLLRYALLVEWSASDYLGQRQYGVIDEMIEGAASMLTTDELALYSKLRQGLHAELREELEK